jgi:hypothetical protein
MGLTARIAFALLLFTAPVVAQVDPRPNVLPDKPAPHCTLMGGLLCNAVHDQASVIPSVAHNEFASADNKQTAYHQVGGNLISRILNGTSPTPAGFVRTMLSSHMRQSSHPVVRKLAWLPQTISIGSTVGGSAHAATHR